MANIFKRFFGLDKQKAYGIPVNSAGFRFFGGQLVPIADNKVQYIEDGYKHNDTIYSIVSLIIKMTKIAPWDVYKVVDDKAYKAYRDALTSPDFDIKEVMELRGKSLELYDDKEMKRLLERPSGNRPQTWSDLNEELWLYKLITGDYYEFWEGVASGGLTKGIPNSLSALPSQYMQIVGSRTLPLYEEKYILQVGQNIEFDADQVLHEKYPNLTWDTYGTQLYGQSPIQAALRRLNRNNKQLDASAVAVENGGQRGVVFFNDDRVNPNDDKTFEQMSAQKKTFQNEMRPGVDGTNHIFWSQWKVDFRQLGFSPADMQQLESEMVDLRFFCNVWGVPSQLLNDDAAKTFNTLTEAEKALIIRCCVPLLCSRRDSLKWKMNRKDNVIFDFDLSQYDQLQPNKDMIATWVNKMPLTNKRKLEIIGEDVPATMTQEEQDAILIPTGQELLSDVIAPMDVSPDIALPNEDNPYQQPTA